MSLAQGRSYLAIPGPSIMPDAVLRAMHRASPNIYEGELHALTDSLIPDLKAVARTAGDVAIYIGNGHAAWEASVANLCKRGDTVLVLATGRFGHGWADMARGLGVAVEVLDFGQTDAVDLDKVAEVLRADTAGRIKAVMVCHTDTSTGVRNDVKGLRATLDATGHDGLLMVDCMASLGCDTFEMDDWGVDVMVAGCQKGLMTPAGLAFVFFNARAAGRQNAEVSSWWNWTPRAHPQMFFQYSNGTAPTHHLYGLRAALDMIMAEGLEHVWARHATLSRALWAACEAWGAEGPLRLNIKDAALRSHSVTSVGMGPGQGDALRHWCEHQAGLTLGIGLGREPADAWFRIGHMGHVNAQMILGCLATIEAGLIACDIPHAPGGIRAAAEVIAAG
ncbi:alanine-glyoxylate transaminase / serine-glyoxylate transaminase / serine-pyruvate transaminase [Loktanella atrilutea]|uniref:Alanine-glyoxylate transaminase / serine-glyoxylate transaminase / serine-pyruvate transaminase n=1 Tax=Loktanella atrilutea TaxID=366533 RepID=A0A1M4ST02_LOKAT|nr:aminotransferase class V-fold PLP-dependent enzyme [Loktanella atrilutea]SHE35316.1 alanine-glyoxylate transaminase / serine-glyoxylate transaminase / serine-pyruvate transaminase [Loktanella atrilutea]